jgi:hypothetical protein
MKFACRLVLSVLLSLTLLGANSAVMGQMVVHEHGISHYKGRPVRYTTWEKDGIGTGLNCHPNDPSKGKGDPMAGNTRHQHYDETPLVDAPSKQDPFTISGVWVNRTNYNFWQDIPSRPVAPYPIVPHGYIDESSKDNIPRFRFVGDVWNTNNDAKSAKALIVAAFKEWSALQAGTNIDNVPLTTGLEFMEVGATDAAEINVNWGGTTSLGETIRTIGAGGVVSAVNVHFNNSANNWFFGKAADTPDNRYHFYSTALHEVGHVVGLYEQTDNDDVMIESRNRGKNGPAFDTLDGDSKRGAYALYSIPACVPEPGSLWILSMGSLGMVIFVRRRRK